MHAPWSLAERSDDVRGAGELRKTVGRPRRRRSRGNGGVRSCISETSVSNSPRDWGPHYNAKFTRKALETETAFGHIVPKYAVNELDSETLQQCVGRTVEPVKKVVLDWKGMTGADKNQLLRLLAETSLEIEKI